MKKLGIAMQRNVIGGWKCAYGCKGHPKGESAWMHYFLHLIGVYKP